MQNTKLRNDSTHGRVNFSPPETSSFLRGLGFLKFLLLLVRGNNSKKIQFFSIPKSFFFIEFAQEFEKLSSSWTKWTSNFDVMPPNDILQSPRCFFLKKQPKFRSLSKSSFLQFCDITR